MRIFKQYINECYTIIIHVILQLRSSSCGNPVWALYVIDTEIGLFSMESKAILDKFIGKSLVHLIAK